MKKYILLGVVVLLGVVGLTMFQKPISLPENLPDVKLPSFAEEGKKLQGLWKIEQILEEDETGNLKEMRRSVPGATDNYFSFEGKHICTDGQLDSNNKPLRCQNYTTYSVSGNTISIDQPGKAQGKATWTITGDTLEISFTENQKKGKFILTRLPKK